MHLKISNVFYLQNEPEDQTNAPLAAPAYTFYTEHIHESTAGLEVGKCEGKGGGGGGGGIYASPTTYVENTFEFDHGELDSGFFVAKASADRPRHICWDPLVL